MWIYRVDEPLLGVVRIREWRRYEHITVSLLALLLCGCAAGLVLLDQSDSSFPNKGFTALWDGVNLVTTLGDFAEFNQPQKIFMLLAMFATLLIGGFAVSRLTGLLSGDDVMVYRENRVMERKLDQLANHGAVVGFHSLGELVANRVRQARQPVLVLDGALNASLTIVAPGENPLRKGLFERAVASYVVIADEIVADALVGGLTNQVEATP